MRRRLTPDEVRRFCEDYATLDHDALREKWGHPGAIATRLREQGIAVPVRRGRSDGGLSRGLRRVPGLRWGAPKRPCPVHGQCRGCEAARGTT